VYCLDSQFINEANKFIAGSLQALSAMVQLEVPHISLLTKVDLMQDKVRKFLLDRCHRRHNARKTSVACSGITVAGVFNVQPWHSGASFLWDPVFLCTALCTWRYFPDNLSYHLITYPWFF